MPRFMPIPDPSGSREPPRRYPPTAVATAAPDPAPWPHSVTRSRGVMATVRFALVQVAGAARRAVKTLVKS